MAGLVSALVLKPGVTAVIGGGGKTTLLRTLGEDLMKDGYRVLLCTTTKIFPFPGLLNLIGADEDAIDGALLRERLACVGTPVGTAGKLSAPAVPMAALAVLADFVLVEADGSAGRPLKAHASHEPVVPPEANQVIFVTGASGFGMPILAAAHRPETYARLAGVAPSTTAAPDLEARVRTAEGLPDRLFVNQVESPGDLRNAIRLAHCLPCPVFAGALRRREFVRC